LYLEDLVQKGYACNVKTDNGTISSGPRFRITPNGLRKLAELEKRIIQIPLSCLIKTFEGKQIGSSSELGSSLEAKT
jgi:hypothetical protein